MRQHLGENPQTPGAISAGRSSDEAGALRRPIEMEPGEVETNQHRNNTGYASENLIAA